MSCWYYPIISFPGFNYGRSDVLNGLREFFLKDFLKIARMSNMSNASSVFKKSLFNRKTSKTTKQPVKFKGWKGHR